MVTMEGSVEILGVWKGVFCRTVLAVGAEVSGGFRCSSVVGDFNPTDETLPLIAPYVCMRDNDCFSVFSEEPANRAVGV